MPTDLSELEDRLRAAYSDVAATVRPDDISEHAPAATSPLRWRAVARTRSRRGPALATAAAVLLIVVTATVIPHVLQSGSRHGGARPGASAHVPHSRMAYVLSTSQSNSQSDQLVPVSLVTGRAEKPIPLHVKGYGSQVAISPDGKLAYVLTARAQLIPVDLATGRAYPPIDFGGVPQSLVMTPDGKTAYVFEEPYGVVAVDLATRTTLGFIKVHNARHFVLTPNGKTLYVLGYSFSRTPDPSLTAIDTRTNTTTATIDLHAKTEFPTLAMAPDGKTIYAAFTLSRRGSLRSPVTTNEIIPVDVASNTLQKPIISGMVPGVLTSGLTNGLTISPDSQTGYLQLTHSVLPVDLRTGAVLPPIPEPATFAANYAYDVALSPDSQQLYMIQSIDPTVVPVDTATATVQQPIRLGPPRWVAWGGVFAPGGKTLYILSYDMSFKTGRYLAARMTPIDPTTGTAGRPIDIPAGQDAIAFSP